MENKLQIRELIGKYINRYGYSDIDPVGFIIGTKGKTTLIIQRIKCSENKTKMEFIPGGFSAICINQSAQSYDYHLVDEIFELRYSKQFLKQFGIDEKPKKYYDYNF